jgi:hypothetical protein
MSWLKAELLAMALLSAVGVVLCLKFGAAPANTGMASREEQPLLFWTSIAFWSLVSAVMLLGLFMSK